MVVSPAYGREYKKKADILADWNEGKDFKMESFLHGGGYINKADAEEAKIDNIEFRYKRLTMVAIFRNVNGTWK